MEKIYKPRYKVTDREFYGIIGIPLLTIAFVISSIIMGVFKKYLVFFIGVIFTGAFIEILLIIATKVTVILRDDGMIYKRLDRTIKVTWDEIKKVERIWGGYYGIGHYIVTKKGRLYITSVIENYQDIFEEIKRHTGKDVRWGL